MRLLIVVDTSQDVSGITALCSFRVGRFLIIIDLEKDLDIERDNDHISVGGEANLRIELIEEIAHESIAPGGVSTPAQKLVNEIFDNRSPNLELPMMECFSTDKPVLGTAENLNRAVSWCLENQEYLKNSQGI